MDVLNVTRDAETFTCNAYLAAGDESTLVDAGAYDGVVDELRRHVEQLDAVVDAFDPDVYAFADHRHRTHELADGDTVTIGSDDFEVVFTPGHAPDHVSLVSETALFSGDVVVHDDGAFDDGSFGRTDYPGQSRERLIGSIHELLDRMPDSVEHMYAGHGDVYHGDVHSIIERALDRAERREPKYPDE